MELQLMTFYQQFGKKTNIWACKSGGGSGLSQLACVWRNAIVRCSDVFVFVVVAEGVLCSHCDDWMPQWMSPPGLERLYSGGALSDNKGDYLYGGTGGFLPSSEWPLHWGCVENRLQKRLELRTQTDVAYIGLDFGWVFFSPLKVQAIHRATVVQWWEHRTYQPVWKYMPEWPLVYWRRQ